MLHRDIRRPWRIFHPILAGANAADRAIACAGAVLGIALTGLISAYFIGPEGNLPLMVAPMGASAVLLFAVPASPMAQPWPIFGGNVISAFVGIAVAKLIGEPMVAAGVAVGLAIAVMSVTRCLHPPGGAAAITAVFGGPAVMAAGFTFPVIPVALNAALLVALGVGIHKLTRRNYPHRPPAPSPAQAARATRDPLPAERVGFNAGDVDAALEEIGETFDLSREDIDRILHAVERRALIRAHGELKNSEIMSRDVVFVNASDRPETARRLLLDRNLRLLPVIDENRHVLGCVGLRELSVETPTVADAMSPAFTAKPDEPAVGLAAGMTTGDNRAAVIVDHEGRLLGLVTQTDLLAAMAHELSVEYREPEPAGA